jgi:hypothetical protein
MAKSIRPMIRIHNSETDEIIDREMNDTEFAKYQTSKIEQENLQAEFEAKEIAKQAIADRLGLTADELKLLLG